MEFEFEKEITEIEKKIEELQKFSEEKGIDLSGEIEKFKKTRDEKLKTIYTMKTIKLTLALLTFAICMGSCAMILGIDSNTLMKIQKGMTKEEITSILGQPMHRSFDHEVEGWRYEKSISGAPGITIIDLGFVDGKVTYMDSYEKYTNPPVAVYPSVEIGGEAPSRPHVSGGRGMNERDFLSLYNKVKSKPFKDDQLDLLEAGIGNRGLSCKQCVRMMSIYRFDDDKLEVLKILAPNISDRENYDEIINALDFISSEEKARSILGIKK